VHRPQNDPRIHDDDAPQVLLNPQSGPAKGPAATPHAGPSQVRHLDDLASEFGGSVGSVRPNEGEAAEYGIYYDDSEYDYMQHLREPGAGGGGEVIFVQATAPRGKDKASRKKNAEIEIREPVVDPDLLPSENLPKLSYQSQQNVPDYIAGFQPDMDPRLREVLEALEDEAYVEDDDGIFQELAKDRSEVSARDFEDSYYDEEWDDYEEDGYESDRTVKADEGKGEVEVVVAGEARSSGAREAAEGGETVEVGETGAAGAAAEAGEPGEPVDPGQPGEAPDAAPSQDWMEQFKKFKRDQQRPARRLAGPAQSELQSSVMTTSTSGDRRKKRKGALTNPSTYSMTSSSLFRTEHMTILDARFDKIDEEYQQDDDEEEDGDGTMSVVSGMSGLSMASSVTGPVREDFDDILDDYLGTTELRTRQLRKDKANKGKRAQEGVAALDAMRKALGPAHIRGRA
jgi:protein LTV1